MTSQKPADQTMSEPNPLLDEVKRRALYLAKTRGRLIDGDDGWEYQAQIGKVHVIVAKRNDRLLVVSFNDGGPGFKILWHYDQPAWRSDDVLDYQLALTELRRAMVLDELAEAGRPDNV